MQTKANVSTGRKREAQNGGGGKTSPSPAAPAGPVPPLFRKVDWLTFLFTFAVLGAVYFITLAPEVTLEDSGELCTASFYAGIPHPPGYPFWAIYSWFWTAILPVGNVAWRVEVGQATAAALACGLVAFMVSRGSSMLMEGIQELRSLSGRWENSICAVSGAVAGLLLGLGSVIWSESVVANRISPFGVPWMMLVLLCLLRWIYAPHQRRYLYAAMFCFGICATIHQTLLVAAMGIEITIASVQPRLGRNIFLGNSILFLAGLAAKAAGLIAFLNDSFMVLFIFYVVGVCSLAAYLWFAVLTKITAREWYRDGALTAAFVALAYAPGGGGMALLIGLGALAVFLKLAWGTRQLGTEWLTAVVLGLLWLLGASFYLYEPLAGMTNPPMQWGYPRTREGFFHALSRGQYEKANPTDLFNDPGRFVMQLGLLLGDIAGEFNWVCLFLALVPWLFFRKMQKRERSWILGLTSVYLFIGVLLVILMNPSPERQSADLIKVFFASSHGVVAILFGYGLALTAAYLATHYRQFRAYALAGGILTLVPAFLTLCTSIGTNFFGLTAMEAHVLLLLTLLIGLMYALPLAAIFLKRQSAGKPGSDALPPRIFYGLLLAGAACAGAVVWIGFRNITPEPLTIGQFLGCVVRPFAPNVFGLPVIASLILVGAVIAFIAGVLLYRERAPLAITLAAFAILPLYSGLGHWGRSEQRDHWFGYWFGHDMFTPPFRGPDGKLTYDPGQRQAALADPEKAKVTYPEMTRDAILFGGTDPGRFCPTYMIFCESFIPPHCQPEQDQHFDRRDVYIITQNALADARYLDYIRAHYYRSDQYQHDSPFFQEMLRGAREREENYTTNQVARLAFKFLDVPFTKLGANLEARRRREGVYPPNEIYTPTPEDYDARLREYLDDAQRRFLHDQRHPGEPKQVKPSEGLLPVMQDGQMRVQISGQVSVMAINGLLTKVIFDRNPTNEFFVEESMPLDWMFPHLTPFGVIMKINRQPLPELTEDIVRRDHEFWAQYSGRLIGNWITYETPVSEIVKWIEKVYLRQDYTGFTGDPKFVRDDQAQKSFSKLRSSIGGIYTWRLGLAMGTPTAPEYNARLKPHGEAESQRMIREAEFALRQAFAFCPYSPEAVYRYVNLLMSLGRFDDALLIAATCSKLDPYNESISSLVRQLQSYQSQPIADLESAVRARPDDLQAAFSLWARHLQLQHNDQAEQVLNQLLNHPRASTDVVQAVIQACQQINHAPGIEAALARLVQLAPADAGAWFNLGRVRAHLGRNEEAVQALREAFRLKPGLRAEAEKDPALAQLRATPEFKSLVAR